MAKLFTGLMAILMIVSCAELGTPKPIDYRETPVPEGTTYCGRAEKHLQEMCNADKTKNEYCCEVVTPTKKGLSFTEFCRQTQDAGIALSPLCISHITSCDQIDACVGTTR